MLWYTFGPGPRLVYGLIVSVTTLIIACPCLRDEHDPEAVGPRGVEPRERRVRDRHHPLDRAGALERHRD